MVQWTSQWFLSDYFASIRVPWTTRRLLDAARRFPNAIGLCLFLRYSRLVAIEASGATSAASRPEGDDLAAQLSIRYAHTCL